MINFGGNNPSCYPSAQTPPSAYELAESTPAWWTRVGHASVGHRLRAVDRPVKSVRFAAAWGLSEAVALAGSAVALWFGYEQSTSYIGCASTSGTSSFARLTVLSAGVSLVFAVAAALLLVRRTGTKAQWAITTVVFAVVLLFGVVAVVGGSACVGFTGGSG